MTASGLFIRPGKLVLVAALVAGFSTTVALSAGAEGYVQVNLFSDVRQQRAPQSDVNLVNPWGMAFSPAGPVWISDNGKGLATLYSIHFLAQTFPSRAQPLVVRIPRSAGSERGATAAPTGVTFNNTSDFVIENGGASAPSLFIVATEQGTISGWNFDVDPTSAVLTVDNSSDAVNGLQRGAVYKGIATGNDGVGNFIYVTNFRDGVIEQYDADFNFVDFFTDPSTVPDADTPGFAPFGIQNIDGQLYVTFAMQDHKRQDVVKGLGAGFVDVFDLDGHFIQTYASGGMLNAPWGIVLAPANFGQLSNDLLIGNFGDGRISAFDPATGAFLGQMSRRDGTPVAIEGLWGLAFGNGGLAGRKNDLLFTAGIQGQSHGLLGRIRAAAH
jgi:uncharacterized protein (TIGR03118 family)